MQYQIANAGVPFVRSPSRLSAAEGDLSPAGSQFMSAARSRCAPMQPDDLRAPSARADRRDTPRSPSHILVVDDDDRIRDLLTVLLQCTGYRVRCAEDGEAGWDAFCADKFDMMITDHEMPRLKGLDLLRRVRAVPRNVPVILTSGTIPWHEPDLLPLLPPGVVLEKPFLPAVLLEKVRGFLTPEVGVGG